VTEWVSIVVSLVLGAAGLVLARTINRDVRLKLAERRLTAYERLWALMLPASPYRPPLDMPGRSALHESFTAWYYQHGDGMLLERTSRQMYFEAKDNLIRPLEDITPQQSRERLETLRQHDPEAAERERGRLSQRQLSLLRTQLKTDLAVFGRPYGQELGPEDRAFLTHCGVDVSRKPWSESRQ
jgi:hypothetical protein